MTSERKLVLESSEEYRGYGFGSGVSRVCELVFNTSMAGYQEILSDPSYAGQAVVMTYPLIGNYGMAEDDYETESPSAGALIVREYNGRPSNFRSVATLGEIMEKHGIPGIYGIDTRKLTRSIRDHGTCKALLTDASVSTEEALRIISETDLRKDTVRMVSHGAVRHFGADNTGHNVVVVDCGVKKSIIDGLTLRGCRVTSVPWNTDAAAITAMRPDGLLVSNGPGDPQDVPEVVSLIRSLKGKLPIFGICLGSQLISLAYGAKTYKLKFGHRGGNHPVRELATGRINMTSQNHSYAVDPESLGGTPLRVTHINLLDGTVEGVSCDKDGVFGIQYHPESAPGPQDSGYLFDKFIGMMENR